MIRNFVRRKLAVARRRAPPKDDDKDAEPVKKKLSIGQKRLPPKKVSTGKKLTPKRISNSAAQKKKPFMDMDVELSVVAKKKQLKSPITSPRTAKAKAKIDMKSPKAPKPLDLENDGKDKKSPPRTNQKGL